MPEEKVLPKERIASSFKQLAAVSTDLNDAAKELGRSIGSLEAALRSLNLGVSAWYAIADGGDDDGSYWSRDIGYTRIGEQWRIALRTVSGNHQVHQHHEQVWAFNDAPRWMCVESVGKLPDLFDRLISQSVDTTEKIKARTIEAEELAAAVRAIRKEAEQADMAKKGRK
ncbi:MAG: hypothetical protein ABSF64_38285 [Bryobacteraceae bacterium]|jgi:hypothetical protein